MVPGCSWVARVRDFDPKSSPETVAWAEEKARQALLSEDPHTEPTAEQLQAVTSSHTPGKDNASCEFLDISCDVAD